VYVKQLLHLARNQLTTILFHRFFFGEEPVERARDRLKRQCEWLRNHFTPVTLDFATDALGKNTLPPRPLLVTIDDAKIEILRIADVFASFELPIAIFACVGWCAKDSPGDDGALLARLVNQIEWYAGPVKTLTTSGGGITVGANAAETRKAIDLVLSNPRVPASEIESILATLEREPSGRRVSCSWSELSDLKASGVAIGGHSVSHVNLAAATPLRMEFEISETQRVLSEKFGSCDVFAYPYGMRGTFSDATTLQLARTGFRYAFLTHSEYADTRTDPLLLPRISMPDRPMSQPEFCVRAAGAGVLYRKIRQSRFLRQSA
jgi:peptidoglycan/xylan/chitin deacetylase (PgdA/CDA1 family)